ncbi:hypothetical protein, partial [Escherichia coli]
CLLLFNVLADDGCRPLKQEPSSLGRGGCQNENLWYESIHSSSFRIIAFSITLEEPGNITVLMVLRHELLIS